ncbi:hypothetical protein GCM10009809_11150 [Isoptericola hypogeus]|uniref:Uncharacterized protein n=1 Tax=Isoptericola hypogeus TaxID=300179 RepID=A0ABN2J2V9_9MICO
MSEQPSNGTTSFPWSTIDGPKPRKRIWVPHLDSELRSLWLRVDMALARDERAQEKSRTGTRQDAGIDQSHPLAENQVLAEGVKDLITRAVRAAHRRDPVPGRFVNWWRGTLVEQAYRNLHAARVQMVDLMSEDELDAEIPGVVARVHSTLLPGDARRVSQHDLYSLGLPQRRAWTRRLMEDGYESLDMQHARLRNFRNIVLSAAFVVIVLTGATMTYVVSNPTDVPLCFSAEQTDSAEPQPAEDGNDLLNCPTGANVPEALPNDVVVVALMGLLGGTVTAVISIRKLGGSAGAYDVPVALAWLKVPLGAITAILGILAVRGQFVPGLSRLDSQDQILAYALLFGFAQQALTTVLDKKAGTLVDALPTNSSQAGGRATASVLFSDQAREDGDQDAPADKVRPVNNRRKGSTRS